MLRKREDLKTFEALCTMSDGDLGTLKIEAISHEDAVADANAHPDVEHVLTAKQERQDEN